MSCGSRITQHSKGCNAFSISPSKFQFSISSLIKQQRKQHQHPLQIRRFRTKIPTKFLTFSSLPFIASLQSKTYVVADSSFRQKEDDEGLSSIAGSIVALGKFDALHIGHRELAIQASKAGVPILLSFTGIAEVLGWAPRAPIVAKCDRERVLFSWASHCGSVPPKEFLIEFSGVRHLTPRQFVEKLSLELGVGGVVAGQNYRFGYKASGDAADLVRLCDEFGLQAYIISSVMDKNQNLGSSCPPDKKDRGQVSSTRVRYALDIGDMNYVSELLGRNHRLILSVETKNEFVCTKNRVSASKSCLLNLAPKEGLYEHCSLILGEGDERLPCQVLIDSTHVHIGSLGKDHPIHDVCNDLNLLGIEFGRDIS